MMNINQKFLMQAVESHTRSDHEKRDESPPAQSPEQFLEPDELALHEALVEIAAELHPEDADHQIFFG